MENHEGSKIGFQKEKKRVFVPPEVEHYVGKNGRKCYNPIVILPSVESYIPKSGEFNMNGSPKFGGEVLVQGGFSGFLSKRVDFQALSFGGSTE